MAAGKKSLLEWVNELPDDAEVGVDEGGLGLVAYTEDADSYTVVANFDLGGIPEEIDG